MVTNNIQDVNILNNTDKIKPLERIRMKQSGIVYGYNKQEWETNMGRCVFDYIIYKYGNIKGFKKICNYDSLCKIFYDTDDCNDEELTDYKDLLNVGVNTIEIQRFCERFKLPMYAIDDNEKCFKQYKPQNRNTHAPAMIYRVSNEHFYPINDKLKIQSIVQITSMLNKINNVNSMVETYKNSKEEPYNIDGDDSIFEDFLKNNYNNILNETFEILSNNNDTCDINDDTIIASLRYNNIRDIKEDIKYCINYTSHLKDIKLKKYLEDFLFENHYKIIFKSGSLTDRLKNINSNICYNSIYRNIFNNNYNDSIKKYNILPLKCTNIVKLLHSIDPSITGSFIDYLIRRIICELLNIEFDDSRASWRLDSVDHICNSEDCRYNIEFEYQDKVEVFKKICTLPYCRLHSYNLTKLTKIYKTQDIIKEIFITSLSHGEAFGMCPNQDNVNRILEILGSNLFDLYTPLMILCKNIIENKELIKLNPVFGGKLKPPVDKYNIPSDADLIINDCLIDIKCTKNKSNSKCCEILQLLGYSALSSFNADNHKKINKIMILNILEGSIYKIDISNITNKNYENYIKFLCNEL
jgi:hypothetical protein